MAAGVPKGASLRLTASRSPFHGGEVSQGIVAAVAQAAGGDVAEQGGERWYQQVPA